MTVQVEQVSLTGYNLSSDSKRGRGQGAKSTCQVNLSSWILCQVELGQVGFVTYDKNVPASADVPASAGHLNRRRCLQSSNGLGCIDFDHLTWVRFHACVAWIFDSYVTQPTCWSLPYREAYFHPSWHTSLASERTRSQKLLAHKATIWPPEEEATRGSPPYARLSVSKFPMCFYT